MKQIPLTKNMVAIVDDEDFARVSQFSWHAVKGGRTYYATAHIPGKSRQIPMHRMILGTPDGMVTDHINGNGLDNRRANLRACTHQENMLNQRKRITNTSGYPGISWDKKRKKWYTSISISGKNINFGRFDTLEEAIEIRLQVEEQVKSFLPTSLTPEK